MAGNPRGNIIPMVKYHRGLRRTNLHMQGGKLSCSDTTAIDDNTVYKDLDKQYVVMFNHQSNIFMVCIDIYLKINFKTYYN